MYNHLCEFVNKFLPVITINILSLWFILGLPARVESLVPLHTAGETYRAGDTELPRNNLATTKGHSFEQTEDRQGTNGQLPRPGHTVFSEEIFKSTRPPIKR